MASTQPRRSTRATKKVQYNEEVLPDAEHTTARSGAFCDVQNQEPSPANYFATLPKVKKSARPSNKRARSEEKDDDFVPVDEDVEKPIIGESSFQVMLPPAEVAMSEAYLMSH